MRFRGLQALLLAVAAIGARHAASAQENCADLLTAQCLQTLGAGSVPAGDMCADQLDAYRSCISALASAAPPPAPDSAEALIKGDAISCEMAFTLTDTVNGTAQQLRGEPTIAFAGDDRTPKADGLLDLRLEGSFVRARFDPVSLMAGQSLAYRELSNRFEIDLEAMRLAIDLNLAVSQGLLSGAILAQGGGPCVWR